MNPTRRYFLAGTALAVPAVMLGCAGTTVAQYAADAKAGIVAIQTALAALPATVQVPAVVTSTLATLNSLFGQLSVAPAGSASSLEAQLIQAAETGLPQVASFFGPYGAAASLAVSGIVALVNAIQADLAPATGGVAGAVAPLSVPGLPPMSIEDARRRYGA